MGESDMEATTAPKQVLKMEIAFICELIGLISHFMMCVIFFYLLYEKKKAIRAEVQRTGRRPRDLRDSTVFLGSATLVVGFLQAFALLIENSMVKDCTNRWVNYHTIIWYILHRSCLMSVYLDRLMTVFKGSQFAYPDWFHQILIVSIATWTMVSMGLVCAFYKADEIKIDWDTGENDKILCSWNLSNKYIFAVSRIPEIVLTCVLFFAFVYKLVELYDKTERRRRASEARREEFATSARSLPNAITVEMGHTQDHEKKLNDKRNTKHNDEKRMIGRQFSRTMTRAETESDLFDTVTVPQPSQDDGLATGRTRPGILGPVTQKRNSDLLHPNDKKDRTSLDVQAVMDSPSLSPMNGPSDKVPEFPKLSPIPTPIGALSPDIDGGNKTDRSSLTLTNDTEGSTLAADHARSASSGMGFGNGNQPGFKNTATDTNITTTSVAKIETDTGDTTRDGEPISRTWTIGRRSQRKKKKSMNAHTFQIVFRRVFFSTATAIVSSFLIILGYQFYIPLSGFNAFDTTLNSFCVMTMFKFCQFLVAPVVGTKCDRFFCCKFVGGGYCNYRVLGYN